MFKNVQQFADLKTFTSVWSQGLLAINSFQIDDSLTDINLHCDAPDLVSNKLFNKSFPVASVIALADILYLRTFGYATTGEEEATGINNRNDLIKAEFYFQENKRKIFTDSGVTLVAPETIFFSWYTNC